MVILDSNETNSHKERAMLQVQHLRPPEAQNKGANFRNRGLLKYDQEIAIQGSILEQYRFRRNAAEVIAICSGLAHVPCTFTMQASVKMLRWDLTGSICYWNKSDQLLIDGAIADIEHLLESMASIKSGSHLNLRFTLDQDQTISILKAQKPRT